MTDAEDRDKYGYGDEDIARITLLAGVSGVTLRPEHMAEVARAWRLMAPHRALVAAETLDQTLEPASLFRP